MASFANIEFNFGVEATTKPVSTTPSTVDGLSPRNTSVMVNTKPVGNVPVFTHDTGAPDGFEVFIGRMPGSTTETILREMAAPFNPIEVRLISKTGRAGNLCGFVVFTELDKAHDFIAGYNGRMMVGGQFPLNVRFADGKNRKKIFIGGLALGTQEEDLRALTAPFGTILAVKMLTSKAPCGFVTFATGEQAAACIQHLHDTSNADDTKKYVVKLAKTPEGDHNKNSAGMKRSRSGRSHHGGKRHHRHTGGYHSMPVSGFSSRGPSPTSYGHMAQQGFGMDHNNLAVPNFAHHHQQHQPPLMHHNFAPAFDTQFNIPPSISMPVSALTSANPSPTNHGQFVSSGFGMDPAVHQFLSSPTLVDQYGQPVQQQQMVMQQQQPMQFNQTQFLNIAAPASAPTSPTNGQAFSSLSNDLFGSLY